jgi:hypothetical protein
MAPPACAGLRSLALDLAELDAQFGAAVFGAFEVNPVGGSGVEMTE